ncbi:MAG: hypothetical protein AAF975_08285, partial [Spirochaetota bacterium]
MLKVSSLFGFHNKPNNTDTHEIPWQQYQNRKQSLRKRLRFSYAGLIAATLLQGGLIVILALNTGLLDLKSLGWGRVATQSLADPLATKSPTKAQLEMLVGSQMDEERLNGEGLLRYWGQSRILAGSNEEWDLRYFTQA